jgi:hypothetical protein
MKIMPLFFILLMALSFPLNAREAFKCKSPRGEMIYQAEPCTPNEKPEGVLNLKDTTPQEAEAAKAKLKAEQDEEDAYDAANAKAEKQRQAELEQQQKLELERRSVEAQEKEANSIQQHRRGFGSVYRPAYGEINP